MSLRIVPLLILLLVMLSSAQSVPTQSGNETPANVGASPQNISAWSGLVGDTSPAPAASFSINATPGVISSAVIDIGAPPSGVSLMFSNSSAPITSLSPGNLNLLDQFIGSSADNATATFTSTSTFTIGNSTISGVPTTYTSAPNATAFEMGYLQDQAGDIVIVAEVVNQSADFNGTPADFQLMLPTQNGSPVEYYLTVLQNANISPPSPPPPVVPPQRIVISPNVSLVVLPKPPLIMLPPPNAGLLAYPILKEMSPGDNALIFPLLEDLGGTPVYASAVPEGSSASLASAVSNALLLPDQPASVAIPIHVPQDVPVGYYALSIEYHLGTSNVSQPLIIHVVPSQPAGLNVYRQVSIDQQHNDSVMQLSALNTESGPVNNAEVLEQVPPSFGLQETSFSLTPTTLNESLITWDLMNLLPNETQTLSYVLPGIPSDLELFTLWPAAQIIGPNLRPNILIEDFEAPNIGPGEKGNYTLKLFNSGPAAETVAVEITGAQGWNLEPDSFNVTIPSGAAADLHFSLTAPADAPDPVYYFTMYLYYDGIQDQKILPVPLNHEKLMAPTLSSLSQQLLAWATRNVYLIILALVLASVAGAALYLAIRRGYLEFRKPRYSEERVDSLKKLQQMFTADKKDKDRK